MQAAGLARHKSQPRDDVNAGDTAMVWRDNKLTGREGWTAPGVVVAVPPTKTSFCVSVRGCLLKCWSEQVRKATDAEWLCAELSRNLADGTAQQSSEKWTTWIRGRGARGTTNRGAPD